MCQAQNPNLCGRATGCGCGCVVVFHGSCCGFDVEHQYAVDCCYGCDCDLRLCVHADYCGPYQRRQRAPRAFFYFSDLFLAIDF